MGKDREGGGDAAAGGWTEAAVVVVGSSASDPGNPSLNSPKSPSSSPSSKSSKSSPKSSSSPPSALSSPKPAGTCRLGLRGEFRRLLDDDFRLIRGELGNCNAGDIGESTEREKNVNTNGRKTCLTVGDKGQAG